MPTASALIRETYHSSLPVLDLSNKNLKILPLGFRKIKNLKYLDLSYNSFKSLPKKLKNNTNLKWLKIEFNPYKS